MIYSEDTVIRKNSFHPQKIYNLLGYLSINIIDQFKIAMVSSVRKYVTLFLHQQVKLLAER